MKAYKGFNEKLQCTGGGTPFQYKVGESYEEDTADLCHKGFHACESPFDVFDYYPPSNSRYCEVELDDVSSQTDDDSKKVGRKIRINTEIGLSGIIDAGIKFYFDKVQWNDKKVATGNRSGASATGDYSGASATGNCSGSLAVGNDACSTVGANGVACVVGENGKCRGALGALLVLTEYKRINSGLMLKDAKLARVDGEKIKENTFYSLCDGEIVEAE